MARVDGDYNSQIIGRATSRSANNADKTAAAEKEEEKKTLFAGDLNLAQDAIGEKRAKASKEALKTIMDTFGADSKLDHEISDRSAHIDQLDEEIMENYDQIDGIGDRRGELQERYGITAESQEQKDLELYQRRSDAMEDGKPIVFSEEEQQRLAKMDAEGLSEYQSQAMELHKQERFFEGNIEDAKAAQAEDTGVIKGINKARLKVHAMVDSQKAADAIIDAANREVLGMLVDEAKENIDDKMEELQEEADKKAEESEKNEQKTDNKGDINNSVSTSDTNKIMNTATQKDILQNEADRLLANKKATVEDLKGIKVDELS